MTLDMQNTLQQSMPDKENKQPSNLAVQVKAMLDTYFKELDGHEASEVYQMVLQEVEQPLLESVMNYTRGNQSKAAIVLGLNRGTLRKKLKQYNLN